MPSIHTPSIQTPSIHTPSMYTPSIHTPYTEYTNTSICVGMANSSYLHGYTVSQSGMSVHAVPSPCLHNVENYSVLRLK